MTLFACPLSPIFAAFFFSFIFTIHFFIDIFLSIIVLRFVRPLIFFSSLPSCFHMTPPRFLSSLRCFFLSGFAYFSFISLYFAFAIIRERRYYFLSADFGIAFLSFDIIIFHAAVCLPPAGLSSRIPAAHRH